MSREIREVPPDWQHPEDENGKYISVFDRTFQDAETEWLQNAQLWEKQQHPHQLDSPNYTTHVTDYSHWDERPTDPSRYRPAHLESPSCYQVYETVTGARRYPRSSRPSVNWPNTSSVPARRTPNKQKRSSKRHGSHPP